MKRLTFARDGGRCILLEQGGKHRWSLNRDKENGNKVYLYGDHISRLAAYEDTGMTPEEITESMEILRAYLHVCGGLPPERVNELVQADKEGRAVVLPCKPFDTIYMVVTKRSKVNFPYYSFVKKTRLTWNNMQSCLAEFGKTVFLTMEEAEAAKERIQKEREV